MVGVALFCNEQKTLCDMKEINDELTYKIIGCAMKVHNTLGNGFQEVIYQRCLAIELEKQGIQFLKRTRNANLL